MDAILKFLTPENIIIIVQIFICTIAILRIVFLWRKFGKDEEIFEYDEYSLLNKYDSADIGFLYNGEPTDKSIASLIIFLANKGYIKIENSSEISTYTRAKEFKIVKLKEYNGKNQNEKIFMKELFKSNKESEETNLIKKLKDNGLSAFSIKNNISDNKGVTEDNSTNEVTSKDLYNRFYKIVNKLKSNYKTKKIQEKIYEWSSLITRNKVFIWLILVIIALVLLPMIIIKKLSGIFPGILLSLIIGYGYYISFKNIIKSIKLKQSMLKNILSAIFSGIIFGFLPSKFFLFPLLYKYSKVIVLYWIGILSILTLTIFEEIMPKRSLYGRIALGILYSMKNRIKNANEGEINKSLNLNPNYFYYLYAYSYAMGNSEKLITIFEKYNISKPEWYETTFQLENFPKIISSLNETIVGIEKAMVSVRFKNLYSFILNKIQTRILEKKQTVFKQEQLAVLGELAGGMAHDINTPISSINTSIMLLDKYAESEREKEILDNMKISTQRIINIVTSMRNQIRNLGSSNKEKFRLSDIINDLHVLTQNEQKKNGCKFESNMNEDVYLYGEKTKLGQVLTNIVVNGIQAYGQNDRKGNVTLTVTKSLENICRIEIEDQAGGIPKKVQKTLFKKMITTKGVKGTGLGLYMAGSIIKNDYNGKISFDVKDGIGTKFIIEIPIAT